MRGSLRCFAQWFRGGQLIYQEKPLKKLPLMTVHSGQLGLLTAQKFLLMTRHVKFQIARSIQLPASRSGQQAAAAVGSWLLFRRDKSN